ncbi:helix-turn-helix domain-containing protein [Inconstantimicrobium porci]|uniref:helix-turn-helix domain-containing protein n=1 Tax=Inconstantimicrobium porci TaxID=2652291 RepID=UPI002409186C|nr:helix-turn-helix domain-containing protein [Inconstantimicrobium porci]MDD6769700.1 helix-turn-helix domain containing protein [Inconstantimicrobium porci]
MRPQFRPIKNKALKRWDTIKKLRIAGLTYSEIGDFLGISKQAVNKGIVKRYPKLMSETRRKMYYENC